MLLFKDIKNYPSNYAMLSCEIQGFGYNNHNHYNQSDSAGLKFSIIKDLLPMLV